MSLWRAEFGGSITNTWASSAGQWTVLQILFVMPLAPFFVLSMRWSRGRLTSDWPCSQQMTVWMTQYWQKYLESNPQNGQAQLLLWMLTSIFQPQKREKKYPQHLRRWDIVWDKMFWHFICFWTNKSVVFSFGFTLTCTCRLPWSFTSSLLPSAASGPGLGLFSDWDVSTAA